MAFVANVDGSYPRLMTRVEETMGFFALFH
jgi:hypothetical protein